MLGTLIASSVLWLLVTVALVRVAWMQRKSTRAAATLRDYERRAKEAATEVSIVGVRLGAGRRTFHAIELESSGFELRGRDGSTVPVAQGVRVTLYCDAARIDDSTVSIPDGTTLLYLPPDIVLDDAPYKTPGGVAYTRGDSLLLFARDAMVFALPQRQRRTSILRMIVFGAIFAATIALCIANGPNTKWNALLFLLLIVLGIDQVAIKGLVTWIACTHPPPPLSAGHRAR